MESGYIRKKDFLAVGDEGRSSASITFAILKPNLSTIKRCTAAGKAATIFNLSFISLGGILRGLEQVCLGGPWMMQRLLGALAGLES